MKLFLATASVLLAVACMAQPAATPVVKDTYIKIERMIPMRDGTKLFTAIYFPRDSASDHPILMERTPYSCNPYGEDKYPRRLGPSALFANDNYIFVYQDVRGRYMSEGQFEEMTPAIEHKKSKKDVDESSDTYDTIDWLLKNISHNNGKVGIYGISYPGFYASAALPDAHPALKAASPQAPVTDEFEGDDANHRGAFFLLDNFSFMNFFDHPRPAPWKQYPPVSTNLTERGNAYDFYLKVGPIRNLDSIYYKGQSKIWNEYLAHTTKDAYWQARNIRPHLTNIKPAVLVVGGWFDAEDMFGALKTYEAIEKQSPRNDNHLIMGPWTHGGWSRPDFSSFADLKFGSNTSAWFQQTEHDFFNHYLKGDASPALPEATVFVTGANEWKSFAHWPPMEAKTESWFLQGDHQLVPSSKNVEGFDEYVSDPTNPVPYVGQASPGRVNTYMAADQRFASKRGDVLYYTSEALGAPLTLAGPVTAKLFASISGTDADFVVKVIDVLPDGTQQLVRAEVLRGKFRNSFVHPEAFVPGRVTPVTLVLNDAAHRFDAGHRLMVQIQSSWFPLVDRNPGKFMDIARAIEADFSAETIRIYHDPAHVSKIELSVLP